MRMSWVFGSSNFVCSYQIVSCIAVRDILPSIGLGKGRKNKILNIYLLVCGRGEEEGLRNIERPILGRYTYFWWVSIRADCLRCASSLGRVVW